MTDAIINKTMDRQDLYTAEARPVIAELNGLIRTLRERGLAVSSWYGGFDLSEDSLSVERANRGLGYEPLEDAADDGSFPWFLYWEIVWVVLHGGFRPGQRVLDLGGSSSLFSFYLAHKGCQVVTVDLQKDLVENANRVAQVMGWNLENRAMDMRALTFSTSFDHVTSICVLEHLTPDGRITVMSRIGDLLRPGGRMSITFDYRNPARTMHIGSPEDVERQFVQPSGLQVRGNRRFAEGPENYLLQPFYYHRPFRFWKYKLYSIWKGDFPVQELFRVKRENDYTFGALFLEKSQTTPVSTNS